VKYRIVVDSCGELPEKQKQDEHFASVPLTLRVNGEEIADDGHISCRDLVEKIAADPDCPKSACPSPEAYLRAYDCGADHIYCLTLSAELSGSYQSAVIGMNLYLEDHPDAKIHVFNSVSASIGESIPALMIEQMEEEGLDFEEIVRRIEEYLPQKQTLFVLDNLETLRKNGRLSRMKAIAATILKIKPVCYGTPEGTIGQLDQARGINKAIQKMVGYAVERTPDPENRILGITHCNCPDRAEIVKNALLERMKVKDVYVLETGGVSTLYANDGGIIVVI
jgi:DegV family protein with EDD domain